MNSFFEINIFNITTFYIPAYSLFGCIGLFFMMLYIYKAVDVRNNIDFVRFIILMFLLVSCAALGSKLLFIIVSIPDILAHFSWKYLLNTVITAGYVFYGGLFGAFFGLFVFTKIFKAVEYTNLLQEIVPSFPLFHGCGRIGCLFAGCCYGKEISYGFYHLENEPDISRIPIQLYESFYLFFLFAFLIYLKRKNNCSGKKITFFYLLLYASFRFVIEFFRGDALRGIWLGLSTSQWISIFIIAFIFTISVHWKNNFNDIRIFDR